jgi:hypothetical protein
MITMRRNIRASLERTGQIRKVIIVAVTSLLVTLTIAFPAGAQTTSTTTTTAADTTTTVTDPTTTTAPDTTTTVTDPTTTTAPDPTTTVTDPTTTTNPQSPGPTDLVLCSWQLPDADLDPRNGVQYSGDDDPGITADDPCIGAQPLQRDGVVGAQVVANPDDQPGQRSIELWNAVAPPEGMTTPIDVYLDVFYPDGSFRNRISGKQVLSCADLGGYSDGTPPEPGSVLAAALETGQIDSTAIAALVHRCEASAGAFTSATISLSVHEPCGSYRIDTHALTHDTTSTVTGLLDVGCVRFVQIDTSQVHWGELTPQTPGTIEGDLSMSTTDALTVKNVGSGGATVGIRYSPMVNAEDPSSSITQFAAAFGRSDALLEPYPDINADTDTWFNSGADSVVCTGDMARLDLTAIPGADAAPGSYSGDLVIMSTDAGEASPCNNDHGAFGGPWIDSERFVDNQRTAPVTSTAPALPAPPPPPTTTTTTEPPTTTTTTEPPTTTTTTEPPTTTTTTEPPTTTTTTEPPTTTTTTEPPTTTTTTTGPPA